MKTPLEEGCAGVSMVDFLVLHSRFKSNISLLQCSFLCGGPVKSI